MLDKPPPRHLPYGLDKYAPIVKTPHHCPAGTTTSTPHHRLRRIQQKQPVQIPVPPPLLDTHAHGPDSATQARQPVQPQIPHTNSPRTRYTIHRPRQQPRKHRHSGHLSTQSTRGHKTN